MTSKKGSHTFTKQTNTMNNIYIHVRVQMKKPAVCFFTAFAKVMSQ